MSRNGTVAIPVRTKQKIKDFETSRGKLLTLISDNPEVFDSFFALSDEYNTAHGEAKDALRDLDTDERVAVGPFLRKARSTTVAYDPQSMSPEILATPGVIKTLDAKVIDTLVLSGVITHDDVAGARVTKTGTAAITGPKLVTVEL